MSGNRMKLNLDELDQVNGGASPETGYFISYCQKKGFTLAEAINNAQEAFSDLSGQNSQELFGGDTLQTVLDAVHQAYGSKTAGLGRMKSGDPGYIA